MLASFPCERWTGDHLANGSGMQSDAALPLRLFPVALLAYLA